MIFLTSERKKTHPARNETGRIRLPFLYSFQLDKENGQSYACLLACLLAISVITAAIFVNPLSDIIDILYQKNG